MNKSPKHNCRCACCERHPVWCGNSSASSCLPESVVNSRLLPVLAGCLGRNPDSQKSAHPLSATLQQLFNQDLSLEQDYLHQENKILHSKLVDRVPLTEADRRMLVKYGLRIKDRFGGVHSHREARNAPGLESASETAELDIRKPGAEGGSSPQRSRHRSHNYSPSRRKLNLGIQVHRWRVKKH